jgi:PEP-CTERM motif
MKIMISRIVVVLGVLMFALGASADTLHGYCVTPAAPCTDNGTITPTNNDPPFFAFRFAGNASKSGSGDFVLFALVPDDQNVGFTLDGTNTTVASVTGALASPTEWNSGFLSAFLTSPTFPHNSHPLGAYLPSTQAVDPGAKGYFVYAFDFGAFNYKTTPDPQFTNGGVPQGTVFFATLVDANGNVTVDTPNSASILEAGSPSSVPEPGTLLMFGSGIIGFAGILRRKINL